MQKLLIAMTVGILLTMTSSGSAQQLTKEMVDNMLKMCGTGQKDKKKYTGDRSVASVSLGEHVRQYNRGGGRKRAGLTGEA